MANRDRQIPSDEAITVHPNKSTNGTFWKCRWGVFHLEQYPDEQKLRAKTRKFVRGKWKTIGWVTLSWKSGNLRVYLWTAKKGIRDMTYTDLVYTIKKYLLHRVSSQVDRVVDWQKHLVSLVQSASWTVPVERDTLKVWTLREALPLLKPLNEFHLHECSPFLRAGFRSASLPEAVERWFGIKSTGLVRRTAKILSNDDNYSRGRLELLIRLWRSGKWTIDHIYTLCDRMLKGVPSQYRLQEYSHIVDLLLHYSPKRVIALFENSNQIDHWLNDAANMYQTVREKCPNYTLPDRPRTARKLHDHIMREFLRIRDEKYAQMELPQDLSLLDGVQVTEGITLVVPKRGMDLIEWGIDLNICIGGYVQWAAKREFYLLGVLVNDQIAYAIQLTLEGECRQFRGEDNKPAPIELQQKVFNVLAATDLLKWNLEPDQFPGFGNNLGAIDNDPFGLAIDPPPIAEQVAVVDELP